MQSSGLKAAYKTICKESRVLKLLAATVGQAPETVLPIYKFLMKMCAHKAHFWYSLSPKRLSPRPNKPVITPYADKCKFGSLM